MDKQQLFSMVDELEADATPNRLQEHLHMSFG